MEQTNEKPSKKKMLVLAALVAASMAVVPAVASAQGGDGVNASAPSVEAAEADDLPEGVDVEELTDGDFDELTDEDLAEIEAIEEELAVVLDQAGIEYEWVEEDGFRWVEIDWEDEAALDAMDAFYSEKFPLTAEDVADINAETEELVEALEAAGVPVTVTTDEDGITDFEINSEDEAVFEAAETVFEEMYGDDFLDFEDCDENEDGVEYESHDEDDLDEDDVDGENLDSDTE